MAGLGFDLQNTTAGGVRVAYLDTANEIVLVITNSTGSTVTLPAASGPPPQPQADEDPAGFACYLDFGDLLASGALSGAAAPDGWWQCTADLPEPTLGLAPRAPVELRPGAAVRVPLGSLA